MFSIIAHFITYQDPQFLHVKNTKNFAIIIIIIVIILKCYSHQ